MSIITSPELFINIKSYPKPGDQDFDAFVASELDKLEYGLTINGVYIPHWLYWHLCYWKTYIPTLDERSGDVKDKFINPQLRDNEWIFAENLQKAKEQKKGLLLIGGRRIAKTTFVASWLGLNGTIYEGSQNVIVGNNKGDINNITLQLDKGLANVEPFIRYDRLLNDWGKLASLGWKEKRAAGTTLEWSRYYIKNTEDGQATEVLAGITPKSLVYDEIGKALMKEAFLASIKAYASPYGWRCVPVLTGTGGDFTKGKDAEEMFNNPDRFNLLAVEIPNENKKTAVFISGIYSVDYPKIPMPLSKYLQIKQGSELDDVTIYATDKDEANRMIDAELEKWAKANDQKEYLKAKMYAPRSPEECFLSNADENPFPVAALKEHLVFLGTKQNPEYVKLYRDVNGKVRHSFDTKLVPISDYPVTRDTNKDAPVVLYEPPINDNPPNFLYIAGADPYDKDDSTTSPSLGSVYIYKRLYDPIGGTYQNRIVASYVARPETMKDWHGTVEMLMELYNATCMIEYSGTNFTQYMDGKNKGHWLADGFNLAKEIMPKTSIKGNIKGLPATVPIQRHYRNLIIQYLTEMIPVGFKETGEPIEVMGLTRLEDPMLIAELIAYRPKEGNYDRLVAFGHVLVYDEYLQKIAPNVKVKQEEPQERYKPLMPIRSPFILPQTHKNDEDTPLNRGRNPFGI